MGGSGTLQGAMLGIVIIGVLRNGLNMMGMSVIYQSIILGVLLLIAVAQRGHARSVEMCIRDRPSLVNEKYPVSSDDRPGDLVLLRNVLPSSLVYVKGSEIEGDRTAVAALQTMLEAAAADGVTGWQISAGYRSYNYQQTLFDRQVKQYQAEGMSRDKAVSATRLTVADPGTSEHHTGLAFDLSLIHI